MPLIEVFLCFLWQTNQKTKFEWKYDEEIYDVKEL